MLSLLFGFLMECVTVALDNKGMNKISAMNTDTEIGNVTEHRFLDRQTRVKRTNGSSVNRTPCHHSVSVVGEQQFGRHDGFDWAFG